MNHGPTLSILIVNYNGGGLIAQCLAAIAAHPASVATEVIVVDNASTDRSAETVARDFPGVRLLRSPQNLGLAKAFNMALRAAGGTYLLSLDNDTRVLPGALDAMLAALAADPGRGAVGGRLYNPDMTVQQTARRVPGALNAVFGRRSLVTKLFPNNPISRRYLMAEHADDTAPYEVGWVSAAALMVRRAVVDQVGGFDEAFFVYWVDADWCARIRRGGWQIACVPQAGIIHDENLVGRGRRGPRRARMVIDFHRGAYLYYSRNHARGLLNPMAWLAFIGLALRAGIIIVGERIRFRLAAVGQR
jgi:GT2 family glycosyltransferase